MKLFPFMALIILLIVLNQACLIYSINQDSNETNENEIINIYKIKSLVKIYLDYLDSMEKSNVQLQSKILIEMKLNVFKQKLNHFLAENSSNIIVLFKLVDQMSREKLN